MELNEEKILKFLYRKKKKDEFLKVGIGDDSALFGENMIITVDSFVENTHFKLSYFKGDYRKLGKRVLYGAISDIAASGGELKLVFISFTLPQGFNFKKFKELYEGIESGTMKFGGVIAGGDITGGRELVISITALGKVEKFLSRSGAETGDIIYISGYPGLSETGRVALEMGMEKEFKESVRRFYEPEPGFDIVKKYRDKINACIDTSDGLSLDLHRLIKASRRGAEIVYEDIPLHPEVVNLCKMKGIDIEDFIMGSGEDYNIVFTSPYRIEDSGVKAIGRIIKKGFYIKKERERKKLSPSGYIHRF